MTSICNYLLIEGFKFNDWIKKLWKTLKINKQYFWSIFCSQKVYSNKALQKTIWTLSATNDSICLDFESFEWMSAQSLHRWLNECLFWVVFQFDCPLNYRIIWIWFESIRHQKTCHSSRSYGKAFHTSKQKWINWRKWPNKSITWLNSKRWITSWKPRDLILTFARLTYDLIFITLTHLTIELIQFLGRSDTTVEYNEKLRRYVVWV